MFSQTPVPACVAGENFGDPTARQLQPTFRSAKPGQATRSAYATPEFRWPVDAVAPPVGGRHSRVGVVIASLICPTRTETIVESGSSAIAGVTPKKTPPPVRGDQQGRGSGDLGDLRATRLAAPSTQRTRPRRLHPPPAPLHHPSSHKTRHPRDRCSYASCRELVV